MSKYAINNTIISEFEKLLRHIQKEMDNANDKKDIIVNSHRITAITKVIQILKNYANKITSGENLSNIQGIGKGTIDRINEIIEKGSLDELKNDQDDEKFNKIVLELEQIIGIGHKTAIKLIKEYKLKSINDLIKLYKSGTVEFPEQIVLGIKYKDTYKGKMPRKEVLEFDIIIHKAMMEIDKQLHGVICGSYRREKLTSNDIDLLLVHPDVKKYDQLETHKINYLHKLVDLLNKKKIIIDGLTYKNYVNKYMGFCRLTAKSYVRRIDIRYMPMESYYTALLYFTGSGDFNKRMRRLAKDMGYKLSEYGIYKIENDKYKKIKVNSEKDIFDILNMEYLTPDKRI